MNHTTRKYLPPLERIRTQHQMQSLLQGSTSIQLLIVLSTPRNTSSMIGTIWFIPISIIEIQGI